MQYSPKLKKAMEQIKSLVKENDIAAFVILSDGGGFGEYLNVVSPSFSCAILNESGLYFRINTSEVGKERARELANGTVNFISQFAEQIGKHALLYMDALDLLKTKFEIVPRQGGETSHDQQNN